MHINVENFLKTLPMALKGMGGIFIVTLVIILVMVLLKTFTADKK